MALRVEEGSTGVEVDMSSDAGGVTIPLYTTTWDLDRTEGGAVNDLKSRTCNSNTCCTNS